MISINQVKTRFFKKEDTFKKKSSDINYNFYWSFIFYTGLVLTLLTFAFGFYLFIQIDKEFIISPDVGSGHVETVKKDRIDKVLEYFSLRKQKSNEILNSPSPIVDPSL